MNLEVKCAGARGLLTLLAIRGIGPRVAERISCRFETLGDVRDASPRELAGMVGKLAASNNWDERIWETAYSSANRIIEEARRKSVRVLVATDEEYPSWLREIPNRPPVIYVKGVLRPGRRYVACIGTREPTHFGDQVTRRIVSLLAERGWSIVSGLAFGVDTVAHQSALEAKGHTVAVLANGLDTVYPKTNTDLANQILDCGGAWLSEQPFGRPAIARNLISRDRLQSGMSAGTIVMQTGLWGGSMHTARFTLLQGRKLFAPVPSGRHAKEAKSQGVLALTQKCGPDLGELLKAQGVYRKLLHETYVDRPPAVPVNDRNDYGKLLKKLSDNLTSDSESGPIRTSSQLTLF